MELAMIDDAFVPINDARISIHDRSVYFGDGIYDVLLWLNGAFFELDRHIARLRHSLQEMDMLHRVHLDRILDRIQQAAGRADLSEATIYLQITRGRALRSHDYPSDWQPGFLLTVRPFQWPASDQCSAITYPDLRWKRCDIKSLNLLANVMAKHAAHQKDAYEAILVDDDGLITEASSTSVMMVKQGTLYAPPLTANILPSITRAALLDWANQMDIPVVEQSFTPNQALAADELLIAGTTTTVMAVTQLDGNAIADSMVGPVTAQLQQMLHEALMHNPTARAVKGADCAPAKHLHD